MFLSLPKLVITVIIFLVKLAYEVVPAAEETRGVECVVRRDTRLAPQPLPPHQLVSHGNTKSPPLVSIKINKATVKASLSWCEKAMKGR